jgi:MarR family 2-MHQ and catechol resistance regulon transcriptional repressor
MDEVVHLFFGLLRPQGPPPSGPGLEMTMGQLRLLFRLRHEGPATMGSIAKAADRSLQSATALIERIERQGLVRRERREEDRRIVECCITEAGRQLVDEIAGHRAATLRQALSVLGPEELAQLHGLLKAMMSRQSDATLADAMAGVPGTRSDAPTAGGARG